MENEEIREEKKTRVKYEREITEIVKNLSYSTPKKITQTMIYREIYRRHGGDPDQNPEEARIRYQSPTSKVIKKMCDNGDLNYNDEKGYYIRVSSFDEQEMRKWRGEIVRRVRVKGGYVQIAPNVMMMQIVSADETMASVHEAQSLFEHYVRCIDTSKQLFKIMALEDCLLFVFKMAPGTEQNQEKGELSSLVQDVVSVLGFPGVTVYD